MRGGECCEPGGELFRLCRAEAMGTGRSAHKNADDRAASIIPLTSMTLVIRLPREPRSTGPAIRGSDHGRSRQGLDAAVRAKRTAFWSCTGAQTRSNRPGRQATGWRTATRGRGGGSDAIRPAGAIACRPAARTTSMFGGSISRLLDVTYTIVIAAPSRRATASAWRSCPLFPFSARIRALYMGRVATHRSVTAAELLDAPLCGHNS